MNRYIILNCWLCLTFSTHAALSQSEAESPVLFYLHGKIIEDQGVEAVRERFGRYEYTEIVKGFERAGFRIISETRPKDTHYREYAEKVADQIRELINQGTKPENITVVGASKGSVIAMTVSTLLQIPELNFVLMANCNDWVRENLEIRLCGRILSIYEASDTIGSSCAGIFEDANCHLDTYEIRLDTGLRHGFIYHPLDEWMKPVISWALVKSIK